MLNVYGVAPSDLITSATALAVFPAFSGRTLGGAIPVDCEVKLLGLSRSAVGSSAAWPWAPAHRGYVVVTGQTPHSVLKNHIRAIRHFQDELGQNRLWPWFDPRHIKLALNTLEGADLHVLFGPIQAFGFAANLDNNSPTEPENFIEFYRLQAHRLQVTQVAA